MAGDNRKLLYTDTCSGLHRYVFWVTYRYVFWVTYRYVFWVTYRYMFWVPSYT